ncbi:MAG: hypothetical protein AAGD06_08965 [Acidobacteriota bacterium]
MKPDHSKDHEMLASWLAAERAGDDAVAEERLGQIFQGLPLTVPSEAFAARVLAGAGVARRGAARAADLGRQLRPAVAFGLLSAGLASAFLLPLVARLLAEVDPGSTLAAFAGLFAWLTRGSVVVIEVGAALAGYVRMLWLVLTAPPILSTLLVTAAVSTLLIRWLLELLSFHRSASDDRIFYI